MLAQSAKRLSLLLVVFSLFCGSALIAYDAAMGVSPLQDRDSLSLQAFESFLALVQPPPQRSSGSAAPNVQQQQPERSQQRSSTARRRTGQQQQSPSVTEATVLVAHRKGLSIGTPFEAVVPFCCGMRLVPRVARLLPEEGTASENTVAQPHFGLQYFARPEEVEQCVSGALRPLAWDRVDDGFCDCDGSDGSEAGSDEGTTNACILAHPLFRNADLSASDPSSSKRSSSASFQCLLDAETFVTSSKLRDGVEDCCDASDEGVFPPTRAHVLRCRALHDSRRAAARAKLDVTQAAHAEYLRRAQFGATVFGPQFLQNLSLAQKEIQNNTQQAEALIAHATVELKKQMDVRVAGRLRAVISESTSADGAMSDEEIANIHKDEERQMKMALAQYANPMRRQIKQQQNEVAARNAIAQGKALGASFEFFPLYGNCRNFTVHEKKLKGGSAVPEQHNVRFQICPFQYLLQQTLTPAFDEAMAEVAAHGVQTDISGYFAIPEPEQRDPSVPQSVYDRLLEIRKIIRATFVGVWVGAAHVNAYHLPSKKPEEETLLPLHVVSLYQHGEPCALLGGKPREARIKLQCGEEDAVVSVEEQGLCEYFVVMSTPSACDAAVLARQKQEWQRVTQAEESFLSLTA